MLNVEANGIEKEVDCSSFWPPYKVIHHPEIDQVSGDEVIITIMMVGTTDKSVGMWVAIRKEVTGKSFRHAESSLPPTLYYIHFTLLCFKAST